jgi:PKD repeat protein
VNSDSASDEYNINYYRFLTAGDNAVPTANFTFTIMGLTAIFTDTSMDSDGTIASWAWSFGDGSSSTAQNPSHTYAADGTYIVWLTVTDNDGATDSFSQGVTVTAGQSASFLTQPYLQSVHTSGITMMWELSGMASCSVDYGLDASYGSTNGAIQSSSTSGDTEIYKSVITGLSAGTIYHYRVNIDGVLGNDRIFTTAPAGEVDFSFAQWGDSQGTSSATIPMMQHLAASGVDIAVSTGDMCEDGGSYSSIREFFLDRVANNVGQYIPFDIAWGNHDDYGSAEIKDFTDFGAGSYSFDYANCHFTLIDWIDDNNWNWIETDLANAQSARHRFVFVHDPPYSERWIDGNSIHRENLVPLLEQYNVDICFSGHTHAYLRGELNGVYYVVSGGGSWLDTFEPLVYDWPHMTVGGYTDTWSEYGVNGGLINEYVKVDITSTGWTATMQGFNSDGTIKTGVVDTFSSTVTPPDTNPPTPDPMTWANVPYATSSSSISMTATTASDVSGVEYYFTCTAGGGSDSGWQDSTTYEDIGLSSGTQYTYSVTARDKSSNQNTNAASDGESATTDAGCSPDTMYVGDIVCDKIRCGGPRRSGQVTVMVIDNCGNPVANALVDGTFSGDYSESFVDVTTDANGQAVFTSTGCVKKPSYSFCVDDITHSSLTYSSGGNVETCDNN